MMPVVAESGTYYYHYNIVAIHSSSFDKKPLLILKLLKKFFHCFSPYNQTNVLLGLFSRKLFLSRNLNGKGLHFNELQTIKSRDWGDYVKLFYCRKATIYCVFREKVENGKPSKINTFLTHRSTMLSLREKRNLEKRAQTMQSLSSTVATGLLAW